MSASFCWEVVKPNQARTFPHGTSNDAAILGDTFGDTVSTKDIPTLEAMHRASGQRESLWQDIARVLENMQGDDSDHAIAIKVWVEY